MTLLARASRRYLSHHLMQCLLAVSGIALGTAIVIGMQLTQASARQAFAASLQSAFGAATHHVIGAAGEVPEAELARVRRLAPALAPGPIVEGVVQVAREDSRHSLYVHGIDPLSTRRDGDGRADFDVRRFMREPGAAVTSRATAARLALHAGDAIAVQTVHGPGTLHIIAVLEADGRAGAPVIADGVVLVDIATAQELLARSGWLSRIELTVADDARAQRQLASLRASLPSTLLVADAGRHVRGAEQLTRAFYTNLDALSLLALLVGAFMIYNTMAFLVVQRRGFFARLRALGVSRGTIARLVAGEALALGALGGIVGVALGHALAGGLLESVTQTLRDHYFESDAAGIGWSPALAAAGIALAAATSLAAALVPAWAAMSSDPAAAAGASHQERASSRGLVLAARLGWLCALLAGVLLLASSRSLHAGFAALGCFMLAAMLVAPRAVQGLIGLAVSRRARRPHLPSRLAARSAARSMGRIGMAVAALMAATATSVGVGIMVGSFRAAVSDWLEHLLRADFYIAQAFEARAAPVIDAAVVARVLAVPGVATVSKVRSSEVVHGDEDIRVTAYELPPAARAGFRFLAGDADRVWQAWESDDIAIISEPFAYHHRLDAGDDFTLATPSGPVRFHIAGVYADYGSERGVLALSLATFARHWHDTRLHGLGVYGEAGSDGLALREALTSALPAADNLVVWSNAEIKRRSLEIFDRTFVVTDVLTLFAALIAALGVFNALLALHLERGRDYAIMLAVGCGPGLIRKVLYAQTFIVGLLAALFALPLGAAIAVLLIEVINIRSFGWSMAMHWDAATLLLPAAAAVAAALAATVYPAERAARIDPASLLRYE